MMKRILSVALALVMVLGIASFAAAEDKVALTIGVPQHANVEDWETNWMTTYLEEQCNVDLSFVTYPQSDMNTQLTLAITATSDLPDILLFNMGSLGLDLLYQWALAGSILPLNEYVENDAVFLKQAIEKTGVDFLNYVTSPDGNLYTLPIYNQSLTNEFPDKIWIYQPWLDKLGLTAPRTADELYNVLKAFKEQDPNGNGEEDEIPLMASTDEYAWNYFRAIMNMFQYMHVSNYYTVTDGQVGFCVTTDEFREGLKFIRKLFDENLIDPMTFTVDKAQMRALVNGETPVVGMTVGMVPVGTAGTERIVEYVGMEPFASADGVQHTAYDPSLPTAQALITSSCKNPQAAFKFLDFFYGNSINIINHWGEEGVHWRWANETDVGAYESMGYNALFAEVEPLWGTVQNVMWYQIGPWARDYSIALGRVLPADPRTTGARAATIQWAYSAHYPTEGSYVSTLIFTEEESDEVSMTLSELTSYIKTALANFCLNKDGMDVYSDDAWDAFINQLDAIGLSDILPTLQTVYDRMY